jgi:hypothetical protein
LKYKIYGRRIHRTYSEEPSESRVYFLYGMEKIIILNMNEEQKKILALPGKQFEKHYFIK